METWAARVQPSELDRGFVEVDREFAARLTTDHSRIFEIAAIDTEAGAEAFTADVPNVGEEALALLDERGLIRVGSQVAPGDLLAGKVTPRGGEPSSAEEKLLRAIFGEAAGDLRDTSLRAPPGCFGVVREAVLEDRRVRVTVGWSRTPAMPDPDALKAWREQQAAHRASARKKIGESKPQEAEPERNAWLDRCVDELELSVASANALANMGVRTIAELCQRTEAEVLKTRGVGRQVLKELKEILAEMGLSLGMRL